MTTTTRPATKLQIGYVRNLQRKLRLTDTALDRYCEGRFGRAFTELDRGQTSELLDEMVGWEDVPASLKQAMGQLDLFG